MPKYKTIELILTLKKWFEKNFFSIIIFVLLFSWYGVFLAKGIDLVTADLGRHLENGKLFFQNFQIPDINLYSYTYPDFPFINHHWGSGALFFLIWKISGFAGLSFFFITLSFLTFFLFFRLAEKAIGFFYVLPIAFLVIPLLGERTEVRPEVISYLFCAIFFLIVWKYTQEKLSSRWLYLLPVIEILWVNSHIYFLFGIGIIGAFFLEQVVKYFFKKSKQTALKIKRAGIFLFIVSAVTILNPYGIKAVIYPLQMLHNYGYRIVENQSVGFLINYGLDNPNLILYPIVLALMMASFLLIAIRGRKNFSLGLFLISLTVAIAGYFAIRNFALFAFFALFIISFNLAKGLDLEKRFSKATVGTVSVLLSIIIFSLTFIAYSDRLALGSETRLGLLPKTNASADFFKRENIKGPIFNNYDIGSYLIFHLYPQEKVFVDNRPETYPTSFFNDVYIPMQENDSVWREQLEKYNFNAIFFYLHDYTPWGQQFLISKVKDSEWAPVYADRYAIIFVRRNDTNKEIISRFEIPAKNFSVTNNK